MKECQPECKVAIAIVEDEKDLVRAYERMFSLHNITICFIAYNGLEAIKKYMECNPKPHVVIMDYRLPILSGIDTMKEIRNVDPGSKFLFLSADPGVKDEALKAGASEFLVKPVSFRIVLKAVKDIIDQAPA